MELINLKDEDCINYKKISMFLGFPTCGGKCWRELGLPPETCQNNSLCAGPRIKLSVDEIVRRYLDNFLTEAIVCGGLEPFEKFEELLELVRILRDKYKNEDDVVIYTGYYPEEIKQQIELLKKYKNIIIKFGRYRPGDKKHFDDVLGVFLANKEQYAQKIS